MNKIQGLGFSPYMDGQSPDRGTQIPPGQIKTLINTVAPYTNWVRTYGCDNGLERIGEIAKAAGLKVAASAWLSKDGTANEKQISNLISVAKAGHADMAIVGSETIYRGDLSVKDLIGCIQRVKAAVPANVQVTTGDIYPSYKDNPALIAAVDVVCIHIYPYWEGKSLADSLPSLKGAYNTLVGLAKGKTVWIGETGWPSAGQTNGAAQPSPENAAKYFSDFVAWTRPAGINYFYFDFMDEHWKGAEGGVGPHWGIFTANAAALKPGMQSVFNG